MTHTALARKYRPKRFAELIAQEHVAAGLAGAVARNRVAHAYLLTGQRGVGKTTAARILAMALNCERRRGDRAEGGEPCGSCDSCVRIWLGAANLDVVEIDAASNRGVDDARDLRERAMYAASGPERSKVYIVDEAHMLTREAWNALLKILEEPPPRVVFVFATTEPHKIANTAAPVLSRMQRFDFRRIGPGAIAGRLREVASQEAIEIDEAALALIARVASGGMRDALSLLDQVVAFGEGAVTAARVRDALGLLADELYAELLDIVTQRRPADVLPFVARLVEAGADLAELVGGVGEALRALLQAILGSEPEGLSDELRSAIRRSADRHRPGDVLRMLRLLADTEESIRRSPHTRLHVETLLLQLTLLDRTVELGDVLQALGVTPRSPSGPAQPTGGPTLAPVSAAPHGAPPGAPPTAVSTPTASPVAPASDEITRRWPEVVEAVGRKRRVLQEALAHASLVVNGETVVLEVAGSDVHLHGLEGGKQAIEAVAREILGRAVRVGVRPAAPSPAAGVSPAPRRLNRDADREERLQRYRAQDPALDATAEALDLELLE